MKEIFNHQIQCYQEGQLWILSISADICGGRAETYRAHSLEEMYKEVPPKYHWVLTTNYGTILE